MATGRRAMIALAGAALLVAIVLVRPSGGDAGVWGQPMTAADAASITADDAGDRRLLAHFAARLDGRVDTWKRRLPEDAQTAFATLRLEEIARTDGLALGIAAVDRGLGDVEPGDAARAYETLGVPAAAELMRSLAAILERDGPAWRAARVPVGAMQPAPDPALLDRIAAGLAGLMPAVRTARLRWLAEHPDALAPR